MNQDANRKHTADIASPSEGKCWREMCEGARRSTSKQAHTSTTTEKYSLIFAFTISGESFPYLRNATHRNGYALALARGVVAASSAEMEPLSAEAAVVGKRGPCRAYSAVGWAYFATISWQKLV